MTTLTEAEREALSKSLRLHPYFADVVAAVERIIDDRMATNGVRLTYDDVIPTLRRYGPAIAASLAENAELHERLPQQERDLGWWSARLDEGNRAEATVARIQTLRDEWASSLPVWGPDERGLSILDGVDREGLLEELDNALSGHVPERRQRVRRSE